MSPQVVEFFYDISCPFAYIASTRIASIATRTDAVIHWRPVLLGAIYRATNAPQGAAGSASDVFNPTKKTITAKAFTRTLQRLGVPHNEPPQHPVKTTAPLRLLYYVDEQDRPELSHALFKAYWVDGKNVSQRSALIEAVKRSGISRQHDILRAIDEGTFEGPSQRSHLETATDDAVRRGAPGVPAFWLPHVRWTNPQGQQQVGRLFWGQDRMQFVEALLMAGGDESKLSTISRPLRSLEIWCKREGIPQGEQVKLEFWYDFSSPWAYLGWTQLSRLQRQFGERLQIEMKPFLLGILFRQIGAPNLPMAAISEQKRKYSQLDHRDWVTWWNAVNDQEGRPDPPINFYWADIFPIRTPTVLRAVIVEPKLVGPLFRGCWEQNLDMANDKVLQKVIDDAGFNGGDVLKRANGPDCKAELRARTQEAFANSICGVPSYRVFRRRDGQDWIQTGDIVWGQDLVADVEDYIAGWTPGEQQPIVSRL